MPARCTSQFAESLFQTRSKA
ncbi:DUF6783 domain-containing protein [Ruminococcus sp. RTP21484sp1_RTP31003st1_F6_RTP31003_210430]